MLIPCLSPLTVAKENRVKPLEGKKARSERGGGMNKSLRKERGGNEAVDDKTSAGGDSLSKQWEGAVR